jgi:hypothetical protein
MGELNEKTISENEELPSFTQRLFEISMRAMTDENPYTLIKNLINIDKKIFTIEKISSMTNYIVRKGSKQKLSMITKDLCILVAIRGEHIQKQLSLLISKVKTLLCIMKISRRKIYTFTRHL